MVEQLADTGLDVEGWTCPLPLRDSPTVVMGHGGGGAMSAELLWVSSCEAWISALKVSVS